MEETVTEKEAPDCGTIRLRAGIVTVVTGVVLYILTMLIPWLNAVLQPAWIVFIIGIVPGAAYWFLAARRSRSSN
jgi:hypothetical protein